MPHNDGQLPFPAKQISEEQKIGRGVRQRAPDTSVDMSVESLVEGLRKAKEAEEVVKVSRIMWEEKVAAKLAGPEDGQKTHKMEDGTKVTVSRGYIFKADCDEIEKMYRVKQLDSSPPIITKTTRKLHEAEYKELAKRLPAIYREIAKHVTVKPKKTAVTIE